MNSIVKGLLAAAMVLTAACGGGHKTKSNDPGPVIPPPPPPPPPTITKIGKFRAVKAEINTVNKTESVGGYMPNKSAEMTMPRVGAKAVTLDNGKVVVIGGEIDIEKEDNKILSTIDIFDPDTETFSASAAKPTLGYRSTINNSFAAVKLPGNKVLLAGGGYEGSSQASCNLEIYDYNTDSIRVLSAILFDPVGWVSHGFLLDSDHVLLTGLLVTDLFDTTKQFIADYNLLYTISTETITKVPTSFTYVNDAAVQSSNGDIYFFGGRPFASYSKSYNDIVYCSKQAVLDGTPTFTKIGELNTARDNCSAVLLNPNEIGIYGGFEHTSAEVIRLSSVELFNIADKTCVNKVGLTASHALFTSVLLQNNKYTLHAGGNGDTGFPAKAELIHDMAGNMAGTTGDMLVARRYHAVVSLNNGLVLICGGEDGSAPFAGAKKTAEIYDPEYKLYIKYTSDTMQSMASQQFICDYSDGVVWTVVSETEAVTDPGTISETGLYTAPDLGAVSSCVIKVTATSKVDSNLIAVVRIKILK